MISNPTTPALSAFFHNGDVRTVKQGQTIVITEQDMGQMFYIDQGYFKASIVHKDGQKNVLNILDAGCFFPLPDLESIWKNMTLSYEAVADTTIYVVPTEGYYQERLSNFEFEEAVHDFYALQIWDMTQRSKMRQGDTVHNMLTARLKFLAYRYGKPVDQKLVRISVPLNETDLADWIAAEPKSVRQELSTMSKAGVVQVDGDFLIVDKAALSNT